MAGDVKTQQFLNDEVKPAIRKTIPDMLLRIEALESSRAGTMMVRPIVAQEPAEGFTGGRLPEDAYQEPDFKKAKGSRKAKEE